RIEWGKRGAREAVKRGDVLIIVDVLSFSSTVVSGLNKGAIIYPYPPHLDGKAFASEIEAEYILGRTEASKIGKPTLSPVSFHKKEHMNKRYVLTSLNGAYCTWIAGEVPALLIGSLLNASAVASIANNIMQETNSNITVVPCGERWSDVKEYDDALRPAVEDYLGAGAILSYLPGKKSVEAEVCIGAFTAVKHRLNEMIWDCGSGRELRNRGFSEDVKHCSKLNYYENVPLLKKDHFISAF
ncbi:2-phosphosulfolactate phosphatase, partial [Alkalicoccus luteus]